MEKKKKKNKKNMLFITVFHKFTLILKKKHEKKIKMTSSDVPSQGRGERLKQRWQELSSSVQRCGQDLASVAKTGFSHRLTAYKIVGHFFGLSYRKISGSNQVKNSFFRISNISVPCPHAQLRGRTVI